MFLKINFKYLRKFNQKFQKFLVKMQGLKKYLDWDEGGGGLEGIYFFTISMFSQGDNFFSDIYVKKKEY